MSCTQKTGGFRVTDAQEAELGWFNCFYINHSLSLNNLSPDTTVFQKLLPKANSPLLNSFPESVFLNPTLNIDLPWRDLIYLVETGLTPPELSNPEMGPCHSWSGNHTGWWQTSQGHWNQFLSFLWASGTCIFENLFYEDGCPRIKVSPLSQQDSPPSGLSRVNYRNSSAYSQEALFLGRLLWNSDLQTLKLSPTLSPGSCPGRWHFHLDLGFKPWSLGRGCCAGSSCLCGLFSSCTKWGLPSSCDAWASRVAGHGLEGAPASVVVAHGLSSVLPGL